MHSHIIGSALSGYTKNLITHEEATKLKENRRDITKKSTYIWLAQLVVLNT